MISGKVPVYAPVTASFPSSEIRIANTGFPGSVCALNDVSTFRVLQQVVFDGKEHFHRRPIFDLPHEYPRLKGAVERVAGFAQWSPFSRLTALRPGTILPGHIVRHCHFKCKRGGLATASEHPITRG